MNEKDIKDAIKQRIADKIQDACDGENIADAIMGNEQNQDFIDTNEQDKVQDMQNEAQTEKDVKDEKEDKETTNREIGKFKKDFWPMKLMQYGQAIFAGGQEGADTEIWCSPISCVKYDGKSICLKLNE